MALLLRGVRARRQSGRVVNGQQDGFAIARRWIEEQQDSNGGAPLLRAVQRAESQRAKLGWSSPSLEATLICWRGAARTPLSCHMPHGRGGLCCAAHPLGRTGAEGEGEEWRCLYQQDGCGEGRRAERMSLGAVAAW